SVPPLSAAKPPNDGITSPPPARIVLMSLPKVELDTGMLESPFQTTVHEPLDAVCRKAIVRCLVPDCAASVAGLCPVQDSKQGANTRLGTASAATGAALAPTTATPAVVNTEASPTTIACRDVASRMMSSRCTDTWTLSELD